MRRASMRASCSEEEQPTRATQLANDHFRITPIGTAAFYRLSGIDVKHMKFSRTIMRHIESSRMTNLVSMQSFR